MDTKPNKPPSRRSGKRNTNSGGQASTKMSRLMTSLTQQMGTAEVLDSAYCLLIAIFLSLPGGHPSSEHLYEYSENAGVLELNRNGGLYGSRYRSLNRRSRNCLCRPNALARSRRKTGRGPVDRSMAQGC